MEISFMKRVYFIGGRFHSFLVPLILVFAYKIINIDV
jgi:hypothetical protein